MSGRATPTASAQPLLNAITAHDPDAVSVTGPVSAEDLPRHYASADVFCSPATGGESFGIVLLEAMAAGVPVVASDIDGYRDVVSHDVNGLLVGPRDPSAIAGAVGRVLDDPALADGLRSAGRSAASEFRWERVASQVEDYYQQCIEEADHRGVAG